MTMCAAMAGRGGLENMVKLTPSPPPGTNLFQSPRRPEFPLPSADSGTAHSPPPRADVSSRTDPSGILCYWLSLLVWESQSTWERNSMHPIPLSHLFGASMILCSIMHPSTSSFLPPSPSSLPYPFPLLLPSPSSLQRTTPRHRMHRVAFPRTKWHEKN